MFSFKFVVLLLLYLPSISAQGITCIANDVYCANGGCSWTDPASWSSCAGTYPTGATVSASFVSGNYSMTLNSTNSITVANIFIPSGPSVRFLSPFFVPGNFTSFGAIIVDVGSNNSFSLGNAHISGSWTWYTGNLTGSSSGPWVSVQSTIVTFGRGIKSLYRNIWSTYVNTSLIFQDGCILNLMSNITTSGNNSFSGNVQIINRESSSHLITFGRTTTFNGGTIQFGIGIQVFMSSIVVMNGTLSFADWTNLTTVAINNGSTLNVVAIDGLSCHEIRNYGSLSLSFNQNRTTAPQSLIYCNIINFNVATINILESFSLYLSSYGTLYLPMNNMIIDESLINIHGTIYSRNLNVYNTYFTLYGGALFTATPEWLQQSIPIITFDPACEFRCQWNDNLGGIVQDLNVTVHEVVLKNSSLQLINSTLRVSLGGRPDISGSNISLMQESTFIINYGVSIPINKVSIISDNTSSVINYGQIVGIYTTFASILYNHGSIQHAQMKVDRLILFNSSSIHLFIVPNGPSDSIMVTQHVELDGTFTLYLNGLTDDWTPIDSFFLVDKNATVSGYFSDVAVNTEIPVPTECRFALDGYQSTNYTFYFAISENCDSGSQSLSSPSQAPPSGSANRSGVIAVSIVLPLAVISLCVAVYMYIRLRRSRPSYQEML